MKLPVMKKISIMEEVLYFVHKITDNNSIVGILNGKLQQKITKVLFCCNSGATFIPLVGTLGVVKKELNNNELIYEFSKGFLGGNISIYSALFHETEKTRKGISKSKYCNETIKYWKKLDVSLIEIGTRSKHTINNFKNLISVEDRKMIKANQAITEYAVFLLIKMAE